MSQGCWVGMKEASSVQDEAGRPSQPGVSGTPGTWTSSHGHHVWLSFLSKTAASLPPPTPYPVLIPVRVPSMAV